MSTTMKNRLPWFAAIVGGVLAFQGYVGFDHFYLEWICLVPILWAIRDKAPKDAFFIGWAAGIAAHAGGFYWLIHMFREFAGMGPVPSMLGLLLLAAANGIVFALWAWATRSICIGTGWSVAWVSPVVWTAAEKFWPMLFPNYLGASQYQLAHLTQIADITGILGVTFLVIYVNSTIYAVIENRLAGKPFPGKQVSIFAAVLAVTLVYGAVRINAIDQQAAAADKLTVGIVQTNRGAGDKHTDTEQFLREHREMSRDLVKAQPLDLIVWPESVFGARANSREGIFPAGFLGDLRTPLLFGVILRMEKESWPKDYNSAVLVDGSERILGTYDKSVLVPFGEYIPFGEMFPQLYNWSPNTGLFKRGKNVEPLLLNGHTLSVNICYEDIFPVHVRTLMQGGAERKIPEAMFNLTNDSWYGNTTEPMEHLALASFRAIEHRRALVRSTNTGVSAIIDPVGRFAVRSGQWTRETLVGRIPLLQGRTLYGIMGDWLGWLCGGFVLFSIFRMRNKK